MAGALIGLYGVWASLRTIDLADNLEQLLGVQVAPMGMLISWLVFNVAMAALFGYVGVMVYRGMKRLGWW